MNIQKAINRLVWRFKNEQIKINETKIVINELDKKAIEVLENYVKNSTQNNLKQNELFAKLFCYVFIHELDFYNGNAKLAQKKIIEQLEKPIDFQYNRVYETLNRLELTNFLKNKDFDMDHLTILNSENENLNEKILKDNQEEIISKMKETWHIDQVYKSLNNTITECLNRFY